ncbi:DUF4115 domain-containing protein [Jannaschia sp. Os4]|uniref:helix-turn-helix domain-containing protein n=1 Tax=Jannaschia sp. Os4 TaxID=2807617 RepID=UPI00193A0EBC|nr:helix-turn-helix domain-containing protein [Jannaschia sp. Os4]MBM2577913.1 DUF4115 domain-containing protein [Jannaschia sp. Os4]
MFGRGKIRTNEPTSTERGYDSYAMRLGDELRGERATLGKSLMDVQRELRIKASYIAAIENTDLSAFDSPSFIAGYVRSYARYLGLDQEIVFARFCEESGFDGIRSLKPMEREVRVKEDPFGVMATPSFVKAAAGSRPAADPLGGVGNPFARRATPVFAGFEPGALGSLAVMALLIGGIGYGGWTVVQQVQRVSVAPVETAPTLVAELDPLQPASAETADSAGVTPPTDDALARLYRPRVLETPILTERDAPISTITPGTIGALASAVPRPDPADPRTGAEAQIAAVGEANAAPDLASSVDAALAAALGVEAPATEGPAQPVLSTRPEQVVLVAVRETWVRVRDAGGATLFEGVMQAGDTFDVPVEETPPTLRTGNSGALYMSVAGQTYGPVAPGPQVVSNVALAADTVQADFAVADLASDADLERVVAELAPAPALPGAEVAPTE